MEDNFLYTTVFPASHGATFKKFNAAGRRVLPQLIIFHTFVANGLLMCGPCNRQNFLNRFFHSRFR